jgi:hypothetical protein
MVAALRTDGHRNGYRSVFKAQALIREFFGLTGAGRFGDRAAVAWGADFSVRAVARAYIIVLR